MVIPTLINENRNNINQQLTTTAEARAFNFSLTQTAFALLPSNTPIPVDTQVVPTATPETPSITPISPTITTTLVANSPTLLPTTLIPTSVPVTLTFTQLPPAPTIEPTTPFPTLPPPSTTPSQTDVFTSTVVPTPTSVSVSLRSFGDYQFALVPAGNFLGINVDEYWIMVFEVSNTQFASFLTSHGNQNALAQPLLNVTGAGGHILRTGSQWRSEQGYENHPAVRVTWYGADEFCRSISGRLPTSTEWQKAAAWDPLTQTVSIYPWGNDPPTTNLANFNRAYNQGTAPVDSYPLGMSPIGAYNMSGNAREWVSDIQGENRTWYGGGWENDSSGIRVDSHGSTTAIFVSSSSGFRCVLDN